MSFTDNYLALMDDEKKKKKKKTGSSFTDNYLSLAEEDDIAPVSTKAPVYVNKTTALFDRDIAPVVKTTTKATTTKEEKKDERKWFEKGAFEDGYQFGDVIKSVGSSFNDLSVGVAQGLGNLVEGVVDLGLYGLAGAVDLMGADNFAGKVKAVAQKEAVNKAAEWIREDNPLIESSLLGEKSDGVSQGLGQIAGVILTGGLSASAGLSAAGTTALTTGVMGASSMGSGIGEAYNAGATDGEAVAYGAIKGAVDAGSELIFGGLGKAVNALGVSRGISSLDDIFAKKLSSKISSHAVKTLVQYGVKSSAEGLEEVLAGVGTAAAKKLTYMSDEELSQLVKDENLLEQFVVGTVVSSIAQGGDVATSISDGSDFITGQSANETAVIGKEVENRIAEQEKGGKKLTNKEKAAIEEAVIRDMERGYISTDTIEEVLGGEDFKNYQTFAKEADGLAEQEKALKEEFDALNKMKQIDMTGEEIDRRLELKSQLEDIRKKIESAKQSGTKDLLQQRLRENVMSLVQNDRLAESYNERSRRGQAYQADISKYDAKQQATIQKAIDSGILNNTNRTHEFVDMIAKITADKGVLFDFTNNERLKESGFAVDGKAVNGYVSKDGITLNIDSAKSMNSVVGHEITHVLEGTEMYTALQSVVTEYAKTKGEYDSRLASLTELYKNVEGADINAELTADLVGDYLFSDTDFVKHLSVTNRNMFQKIYDEIKYLYKVATAGSKEARELEKVKRAFEEAYKAGGKQQADTKYSLTDNEGVELSKEQQDFFKDSKMRDENGNLKVMYHGSQDAGFHVFDARMSDDDTSFFFVDRNDVAASYSGTTETYEAKTIRTVDDMNNFLAEIGYDQYEAVEKNGKFELLENNEHVAWSDTAQGLYEEFCWYEGVGDGDANYKVYLNLANPLEIDAQGRGWDELPAPDGSGERYEYIKLVSFDPMTDMTTIEYAMTGDPAPVTETVNLYEKFGGGIAGSLEDLSPGEALRNIPVNPMTTREYAAYAKEQGYDGVIFKNIVDVGGYGNGSEGAATVAIAFDSNQIKSTANVKPTADKDIRFSLSKPVEQTKDLVALHNLTAEKLTKSLQLGGLPMPSVAIAKAKDGHSEFGEISLVFPKDTIDPEYSRKNKLYSGDAWTPTYPRVEYKPNEKVLKGVKNKVNALVPYEVQDVLGNLMFDADNARDNLDRYNGSMVEAYKNDDAMKYAYLKDTGSDISLPVKEADLYYYGNVSNAAVRYFAGKLANGLQTVELYRNMSARDLLQDKALAEAVADAQNFDVLRTLEPGSAEYLEYERNPVFRADEVAFRDIDGMLSAARKLFTKGVQQTVDRRAAKELIRDAIDQSAYESWLEELFSGVVEKEGIRNNKDVFTPSGNRRSFEVLHYEHSLENVIKAMRETGEKGIGFGGGSIFGAATTEFSSVEEMKQASDRLQKMSDEEYQAMRDGFTRRFFDIAGSLPKDKNSFMATDDAANTLVEAVSKYKTRSGIANYLKRELNGWATYSEQAVDDLIELVRDIRNMPTGYFEAKPQRAVGFEEVGVFVIPNNADMKLKQELLNRGYSIAEYDPNIEGHRQQVVNQFEEYKFSLSSVGEQFAPVNGRGTFGKDIALETAPVEEVAPVQEGTVSGMETVAENATVEESLFPDDAYAPIADDPERFDSLDDADAPPERTFEADERSNPVKMPKNTVSMIAENVRDALWVENNQMGDVRSIVEEYAMQEFPDRNWLFRELKDNFGKHTEKTVDETTQEVKSVLRRYRLNVSDTIKGDIADYNDLRRHNFGKLLFSRQGTAVDAAYEELSTMYPSFFPADITNPTDQLLQIVNVANMSGTTEQTYELDDETVWDVVDDIAEAVSDYQYVQMERDAGKSMPKEAFDDLVQNADTYAPPAAEDIAPVAKLAKSVPMQAPVAEKYEAIRPKRQNTEPKLARATPAEQASAQVLTEEPKVNRKKPTAWNLFKDNFIDKGTVFETLSLKTGNRELQAKWKSIGRAESSAQWFMEHGNAEASSLKSIRETVEKSGKTQQFSEYLYHMHNVDRMSLVERKMDTVDKPVFGYGVTSEMSKAEAAKLEKANPEFKQWAKDVYSFNKALREMMVDNGVISNETAKLWAEMYPHYVPIRRKGDDGLNINVALDTKRTGVNAPVKKATGGNRDILPLFDTMALRTEQTFKAIARNRFGVELKNLLGTTIEKDAVSVDDAIDSVEGELLQEGKDGRNPTFTVFENGERVTFEITDEMYNTMKPKSDAMAYTNKVLNKANNIRRGLLTEYNPAFMLTNPIKDTQDVLMNSQHPARTYANYPKAIAELIGKKGQYYQEYMEHGGEQNTYFDGETKTFAKEKSGFAKVIGFPLEKISQANNFIERIPRMAEYIASRKMGRSIDVSMLDAARVTTDFSAGGDLVKFANRNGFTFLNASVQGAVQQVRNVREAKAEGVKGWAKLAAKTVAAGLPAMLLNHLLWDDDEDYEELSDYVKQNYYVVAKYGDGKFVRIPKGRTLAVIQSGFEQMENLITGNDEVDFDAFAELVISNLAPNNPLENNLIAPIMQAKNNETWYGDDLVPTRLQDLPAAEQFDETTDSLSKWLGEKTNISPYKINYVLDQYSGAVGDVFLPMMTPEAERGNEEWWGDLIAPITDKFTTDSVLKNQNVSDFYDMKDELTVKANASSATDEDVLRAKYMNSVNADLAKLYAAKRELQNSDMPNAEKYEAVRDIQQQIVDMTKEALNSYDNITFEDDYREGGEYARMNGKLYKLNEDGEWAKLSDEQVTKYEVTRAAGDASYATDGTNHYRWYVPGEDAGEDAEPGWRKVTEKELERQEEVTAGLGISPETYWNNREEYSYAYDYPENYAVAKALGGYEAYRGYSSQLYDIKADKDEYGQSISGSRKEKVLAYINDLDADYYTKIILWKSEYTSDDTYNQEIIDYLNSRNDISFEETIAILRKLGFDVTDDGDISW